ncbi:MAG: helix-turn-helix transcriptional regulator [Chloroflexota bacterium]
MGGRRSRDEIEAAEEAAAVRRAIGRGIAAARRRRGWTQDAMAGRVGTSQSAISRLERGVPPLEIGELVRVAQALGIATRVELGRDPHDGPADAGHLAIQDLLVRLARATAGAALVELPLGTSDRSLSVDVCVLRRRQGELIVQEAWNRIGDVGAGLRSFDRKLALAAEAASAFPAPPSIVTGVWVVRATRSNRELLASYPALFAARFTGSSRVWVRALVTGSAAPRGSGLVLCDVGATRLFEWRPASGPARPADARATRAP